jgi:hypothetical protein
MPIIVLIAFLLVVLFVVARFRGKSSPVSGHVMSTQPSR